MMFETQLTDQTTRPWAFILQDGKCLSWMEENKILVKDVLGMSLDAAWCSQDKSELTD